MLCQSQCSLRMWKAKSRDRQTEPSPSGWAVHTSALLCARTSVRLLSRKPLYRCKQRKINDKVTFQVITAVLLKIKFRWHVTLCR